MKSQGPRTDIHPSMIPKTQHLHLRNVREEIPVPVPAIVRCLKKKKKKKKTPPCWWDEQGHSLGSRDQQIDQENHVGTKDNGEKPLANSPGIRCENCDCTVFVESPSNH